LQSKAPKTSGKISRTWDGDRRRNGLASLTHLTSDRRFQIVKLSWASGIVIAVRVDETAHISP
jgi:hypothetical protein